MPIPFPLMAERPYHPERFEMLSDLYAQGARLLHLDSTASEDIYNPELRVMVGAGQWDYSYQDAYWRQIVRQCPDAQFCLRLYVASPPWWDAAHPEELQCDHAGDTKFTFRHTQRSTLPSLASELWRSTAADAVRRYLLWLEASGWSERVWGLFLGYGITWEWGILGSDRFVDYSTPMQQYFLRWLGKQYASDCVLQGAWGQDDASLLTASIPGPEARLRGDGDWRVFPRDRPAYDFQRCLSDVNADYLLLLARTVRQQCGEKYQLGTWYGFTGTAREHQALVSTIGAGGLQGGHHALGKVLDERLFDFWASPYAYQDQSLETGVLMPHFPWRSTQMAGCHTYLENDLWMYPHQPAAGVSRGASRSPHEDLLYQRWALGSALARGESYWWTELMPEPGFTNPELLSELKTHLALFEKHAVPGASGNAQIAIVLDEATKDALALDSKLFLHEVYQQFSAWAWCGAPFDVWLACDATAANMAPYRLVYVFAQRVANPVALRTALCCDARTVWWAPGSAEVPSDGTWQEITQPCAGQSPAQLATFARAAGAHLYGEVPLQVWASDSVVSVHVNESGCYRLTMRHAGPWRELFSGLEFTGCEFSCEFEALETRIFVSV